MSDYAAMAQSVERYLGKVEVVGSSPISSFDLTPISRGFFIFNSTFNCTMACFVHLGTNQFCYSWHH